eukprot:3603161-Prymnesium_polylepis.1
MGGRVVKEVALARFGHGFDDKACYNNITAAVIPVGNVMDQQFIAHKQGSHKARYSFLLVINACGNLQSPPPRDVESIEEGPVMAAATAEPKITEPNATEKMLVSRLTSIDLYRLVST